MIQRRLPLSSFSLLFFTSLFLSGCGSPNRANIALRKEIQDLDDRVASLQQQSDARQRMIQALQASRPTEPTLPARELTKLFVAYGIEFARLTGGADLDPIKPGDEGVKVYASPVDENGAVIQAAGTLVVEAFDLDAGKNNQLGRWEFPTPESKKLWHALLLEAAYELTCPWQHVPTHPNVTLKLTFTDELTHASYSTQKVVTVQLPPPASAAATARKTQANAQGAWSVDALMNRVPRGAAKGCQNTGQRRSLGSPSR
jgi:hypothetical protein